MRKKTVHTELQKDIKRMLAKPTVFRNSAFSVEKLACDLNIGRTLLMKVITQEMNTTFRCLINASRMKYAEKLIASGKAEGMTMEDIALYCGFGSRASYYRVKNTHSCFPCDGGSSVKE